MPAKAGIQGFKKLNKIKNWIPASAGMTALFPQYDAVSKGGGLRREFSRTVGEGVMTNHLLRS
jgi:hypothetical protein